jgi:hypothetical protein
MTELRHCCRRASNHATSDRNGGRRSHRSNRHLHHRRAEAHCCASAIEKHAGEQAKSALQQSKRRFGLKPHRSPRRTHPAGRIPRYDRLKADFSPLGVRSIRDLHHQRSLAARCGKRNRKTNSVAALGTASRHSEPVMVRSAIGIRLAPRSLRQAPRFGRAHPCASPGIRVSRSGLRRTNYKIFAPENKIPSGACWLGRVRVSGLSISLRRDRSDEPGTRYRLAGSHSTVGP